MAIHLYHVHITLGSVNKVALCTDLAVATGYGTADGARCLARTQARTAACKDIQIHSSTASIG